MRRGSAGFTLVETVVAMLLVSVVALPASLWLYRSRANHAAWERFHAAQALERRMNRALLVRHVRDQGFQAGPPGLSLELRLVEGDGERRILGVARDRRGRAILDLEAVLFERGGP